MLLLMHFASCRSLGEYKPRRRVMMGALLVFCSADCNCFSRDDVAAAGKQTIYGNNWRKSVCTRKCATQHTLYYSWQ